AGCNEITWCWVIGMLISPCLKQWMIEYMFTCAVTSHHCEVVYRLDARTDASQQARCTCRSLCQKYRVTNTLLFNLFLKRFGQTLDELPLQVLLAIEGGERTLLYRY